MDGGASSPATATPSEKDTISCGNHFDWKFERLRPSRAHPEADGTDSPPHHPFSDSAEILRISGRGICKEAIFSPGGKPPLRKNQRPGATNRNLRFRLVGREATCLPFGQATFPPRRSPASIGSREGSHLLELSGAVLAEILVFDDAGCPFGDTVSDDAGVGRSASLLPTGCERVATLSRSPGAVLAEILVPDDAGCPLGDTVSDGAGYSLDGFVFDDTSVRRSAPLHPLGGRGREGCDPLALSRSCSGGDIRFRRGRLFS